MTEAGYQDFANHLTFGHHLEITMIFCQMSCFEWYFQMKSILSNSFTYE